MKLLGLILIIWMPLQAFEYGLKPSKVSEAIYCFFGAAQAMNKHNNGNMVNSCFVDMGNHWVAIDSGPTYRYAKEAFSIIQKIKDQPLSYVINTHIHDDHWLGNAFYQTTGTTIVGSAMFQSAINTKERTRMQNRITPEAFEGTVVTLPSQTIKDDAVLTVDGKELHLLYQKGKAHTQHDLIVSIPSQSALFAGDLIFNDRVPSLRDGDINLWIQALEKIDAMDLKTIVGGHGKLTDATATRFTMRYLKELKEAVKTALDEGEDIDTVVKNLDLASFQNQAMYQALHKQNVETAYRTLEWADE